MCTNLFCPLDTQLIATGPLPSSEGCRPPNVDVNGFREGMQIGGGW